ncbi:MAG TPA: SdpI family protein [Longimicrobium sp.]|nr:SdpI family protein [Longimicrobium sp.]
MKSRWLGAAVAAAMWAFALAVSTRLPHRIPSHWNLRGEVDGWMEKPWGVLMQPAIATVLLVVLWVLPRIDPRRENVERFADDRRLIINLIVLFLAVVQVTTLGYALGWPVQVDRVILASVGLLFVGLGNYLPRIRSNWFMGIRTPWTLDNERVWRATHRVGGRTFVAAGLVMALAALLPEPVRVWAAGAAIAVAVAVPLVYSYVAYRRDLSGRPV